MSWVNDWRGGSGMRRALLRFDEVCEILSCSRTHVYDLLGRGEIHAQNPSGRPTRRGTRIIAASVTAYIERTTIDSEEWNK